LLGEWSEQPIVNTSATYGKDPKRQIHGARLVAWLERELEKGPKGHKGLEGPVAN